MIKIYDASDITEAHIVRGMLEAHGIPAHVGGHYLQGGVGDLMVQGFASVQVEEKWVEQARELLLQYQKSV